jgi:RHS repeat-associated protein
MNNRKYFMYSVFFYLFSILCSASLFPSPVSASTTLYFGPYEKTYDDAGNVVETKTYIPAGGATAVKTYNPQLTTYNISYLHSDHLGSTVLITKADETVQSTSFYYPYGNPTDLNLESGIMNQGLDKLYTGQRKDKSTNLYFYNARYYNPMTGKFISADKAEGPNRYAYVGNNPIMKNDPTGNCAGVGCFIQNLVQGFGQALENKREWDYYYAGGNSPKYGQAPVNFAALQAAGSIAALGGGAGLAYGTEIAGGVTSAYIAAQSALNSNTGQKITQGADLINTTANAVNMTTGDPISRAVAAVTDPISMMGGFANPGFRKPGPNNDIMHPEQIEAMTYASTGDYGKAWGCLTQACRNAGYKVGLVDSIAGITNDNNIIGGQVNHVTNKVTIAKRPLGVMRYTDELLIDLSHETGHVLDEVTGIRQSGKQSERRQYFASYRMAETIYAKNDSQLQFYWGLYQQQKKR